MKNYSKKNNKRKKYRVKSSFRFITSLVLMFALLIGGIGFVRGLQESVALTTEEPFTVEVSYGDTLWDLAAAYKSKDTDVRKAVFDICQANQIQADDLEPGMQITIPESL